MAEVFKEKEIKSIDIPFVLCFNCYNKGINMQEDGHGQRERCFTCKAVKGRV